MSERFDTRDVAWPLRPWIMAAICAVAGLVFSQLVDFSSNAAASPLRPAAAAFVAIAAISFVITVEQRRWHWALGFALGWGLIVALVGWFTASYNQHHEIFEFPFLSGIFAVLLAAPLFETVRDEGAWHFPYARLHGHAWTDAVIGAASLAFVGITFLLAWLIAGLFGVIGIDALEHLLRKDWFDWMLAGFAFGAAVGLLRERDALVGTLQRLVMVVLSVLAPVLAAALVLFLLSIPFTGLSKLWDSSIPATPLMLVAAAGAVLLVNAVIGNGRDERASSRVLRLSALLLLLCVLPLALVAALSLGQRIGQYGWTPERMWGVVAVAVAIAYGAAGWWSALRRRGAFDDALRPLQTKLAIALCGLALLLALPIVDFGAISARSQLARLVDGRTPANQFDWQAMAFDFGPAGRAKLNAMTRSGRPDQRRLAAAALAADRRYQVDEEIAVTANASTLDDRLRVEPATESLAPDLRRAIAATRYCRTGRCIATRVDDRRWLLVGAFGKEPLQRALIERQKDGSWSEVEEWQHAPPQQSARPDLGTARVEIRPITRRQLFVDGQPVGRAFE